ncbi:MAG: hypothetical protein QM813_28005 [Verrucomicrobiota bacterium]
MPLELQIISASEFIRLDARELLDFEASKQALRALALACRTRGLNCALLDLRHLPVPLRPLFTAVELATLVGTFREAGFSRQQRLAILYHHDVHGGIRNFAFISRIRGLQVQAFSDYETAMQWLSNAPASAKNACNGATPVAVKKIQPKPKRISVRTENMMKQAGACIGNLT